MRNSSKSARSSRKVETVAVRVAGWLLSFAVVFLSALGYRELIYTIHGSIVSYYELLWFLILIVPGLICGPVMTYMNGADGWDWGDWRYGEVLASWAFSIPTIAIAILGAVLIANGDLFPASPFLLAASVILGILCTALLFGLGQWRESRMPDHSILRSVNSIGPLNSSPEFNTPVEVRPPRFTPAVWASVAAVGTFCGVLASIFTNNFALQLILAFAAAAAAGIFAYIQLSRSRRGD
jgi:hypothetical protein